MDPFLSFISNVRWQDVVDIAISSYILFRLYVLFRGTNVFRIIYGITLLLIFQRIAAKVGLIVTSWALQGIFAVSALLIIIVFRNEIRSVLESRSFRALLWGFSHTPRPTPVQIIVKSVHELAESGCGALLVFAGQKELAEIVQGGVPWRGMVSREMILSIFWKGSPVHDGAAILSGDTVTRVGTILPLSQRKDLPSYFGTRHRAAAGLSEACDALVIAVSEERSNVIAFKESEYAPVEDNLKLTGILTSHLGMKDEESHFFSRDKFEVIAASLASFLLITAVWFGFTRGLETLTTLEVPLEYINRRSQMEIVETSTNSVHLTLSGSVALIKSLNPEQLHVKLDLEKAQLGEYTLKILPTAITLPPGLSLKGVEPESVRITTDLPAEKRLPVQIDWQGKLAGDLVLSSATVTPATIQVAGWSRTLSALATLYTEKVPLDAISGPGKHSVNLLLPPDITRLSSPSDSPIRITYITSKRRK